MKQLVRVHLTEPDRALLVQALRHMPKQTMGMLCKEIIGNWCADKRAAQRLQMPDHHYTARGREDHADVE